MRVKVGRVVDVDKPVNLVNLSKFDRILYAGIDALHHNRFYIRRIAKTTEKEEERKRQIRENLTDGLLAVIYSQITTNQILKEKGDICVAVAVEIPKRYVPFIDDVITTKDFIAYDMQHITPNRGIDKFAEGLPHIVKITQRKEVASN